MRVVRSGGAPCLDVLHTARQAFIRATSQAREATIRNSKQAGLQGSRSKMLKGRHGFVRRAGDIVSQVSAHTSPDTLQVQTDLRASIDYRMWH